MPKLIQTTYLHCGMGGSDKVYIVQTEKDGHNYNVIAQYGRRGSTLNLTNQGAYMDIEAATRTHASVVQKKITKGYNRVDANFALNALMPKHTSPVSPLTKSNVSIKPKLRKISHD